MVKKSLFFSVILSIFLFNSTYAHPGRTDGNGGHTCRTNCGSWGLSYGEYHYHNGGSRNSGSSGSKPAYDPKVEYDKGYSVGYKTGIEMGYKEDRSSVDFNYTTQEYKNGWNEGYQKGWEEGFAKKRQEQTQQQETEQGKKEGLNEGEAAFSAGKKFNEYTKTTFVSDFYKKAYLVAFEQGWNLAKQKKYFYELGFKQGTDQDEINPPTDVKDEAFLVEFQKGFNAGAIERYNQIGYEDGMNDTNNEPKQVKDSFLMAYQEGYKEGQEELKKTYLKQGYDAAFTMFSYESPSYPNSKYVGWFKEGFESNQEVEKIRNTAFKLGKKGSDLVIPSEYANAKSLFTYYYELGVQEQKKDQVRTTIFWAIVLMLWLLRRFIIARRMIK